jgi:tungstate transport system substrate-binding protein
MIPLPQRQRSLNFILAFCLIVNSLSACSALPSPASAKRSTLILATTTSLQDSGLLDILVPRFEAQSGLTVKTIAVGSGQALKLGSEGNADILLTHDPEEEIAFMQNGYGVERIPLMANQFILVGPSSDPAQVKGTSIHVALHKIAKAQATFISRGDQSGTHKIEKALWAKAGIQPAQEPWYLESGQGMAATLTIASEKGAYTLTDRATFLVTRAQQNLVILVEGDPELLNVYHIILVNPQRFPQVNFTAAKAFARFLTSPQTKAFIRQFGQAEYGEPLFMLNNGP